MTRDETVEVALMIRKALYRFSSIAIARCERFIDENPGKTRQELEELCKSDKAEFDRQFSLAFERDTRRVIGAFMVGVRREMEAYFEEPAPDFAALCREFVNDVNAAGGIVRKPGNIYAPVADPEWTDLGALYIKICQALGVEQAIKDEE